ncbi:pyrimidine-nucleoside phosphorylase [Natronospora cellulosivora (SeqCode)]
MRAYDIIYKKREGDKLSKEEINFLIESYSRGDVPDYQMSAWAMAVYFQGLDKEETSHLTTAMAESGDMIDLSAIDAKIVDKHSTGGVGDKTTLVLAPLVSAAGIPLAKMSGRGLGHTGGTIDKLESIPGFSTEISSKDFIDNVNFIGISIMAQTANITPADKKLYALRDVTATVDSIPLIASSIMSKKIAGGANGILLDVKTGNGAFMRQLDDAIKLAEEMVSIGKNVGRETIAVISDMNQPLGDNVGNILEVQEAIDTLRGEGPEDLRELCLTLGAYMLVLADKAEDYEEGYQILNEIIASGKAMDKFLQLIEKQGGDSALIKNDNLPEAEKKLELKAEQDGFVTAINAREIGLAAMLLGAGRESKESKIDHLVGIKLLKKVGDKVKKDEPLLRIYYNNQENLAAVKTRLKATYSIEAEKAKEIDLIHKVIL